VTAEDTIPARELDRVWMVEASREFSWRRWDGEIVLYDDRTGDIHHFDVAGATIFEQLLSGPRPVRDLVSLTADRLRVVGDSELAGMVWEILMALREKHVAVPLS
jgi:hypothetical protein